MKRHTGLVVALIVVTILGAAIYRFSPLWPGPGLPEGATRLGLVTEPAHLMPTMGCAGALLLPARIAVENDALVLMPESGGAPITVVWPAGWAAWRLAGRAMLVSRDGTVIGREGEVVEGFGGGVSDDRRFHVCVPFG